MILQSASKATFLGAFIFFWVLVTSLLVPYVADDWCLIQPSWPAIFSHLHEIYVHWTGRLPAHFMAMGFLHSDKWFFDFANALCFAFTVSLVGRVAVGCWWRADINLAAFALLLFGLPAFGEAVFWVTGSANYLWTTAGVLLFLMPFVDLSLGRPLQGYKPLLQSLWPLLGIFSGWTNENTAPAALVIAALCLAISYRRRREVPLWLLVSGLCMAVGFVALVLAPGNFERLHAGLFADFLKKSFGERLVHFAEASPKHFLSRFWPIWLFVIAALGTLYMHNKPRKEELGAVCVFLVGFVLAVGALVLSPYVEKRALTGAAVFLTVAGLIAADLRLTRLRAWGITLLFLGALSVLCCAWVVAQYYSASKVQAEQRQQVAACKAEGTACAISNYPGKANRFFILPAFGNLSADLSDWINLCRAKQEKVFSIRAFEKN
jgi:Family of unknown function (DUF6056)